jgi:hypothetical protein
MWAVIARIPITSNQPRPRRQWLERAHRYRRILLAFSHENKRRVAPGRVDQSNYFPRFRDRGARRTTFRSQCQSPGPAKKTGTHRHMRSIYMTDTSLLALSPALVPTAWPTVCVQNIEVTLSIAIKPRCMRCFPCFTFSPYLAKSSNNPCGRRSVLNRHYTILRLQVSYFVISSQI